MTDTALYAISVYLGCLKWRAVGHVHIATLMQYEDMFSSVLTDLNLQLAKLQNCPQPLTTAFQYQAVKLYRLDNFYYRIFQPQLKEKMCIMLLLVFQECGLAWISVI